MSELSFLSLTLQFSYSAKVLRLCYIGCAEYLNSTCFRCNVNICFDESLPISRGSHYPSHKSYDLFTKVKLYYHGHGGLSMGFFTSLAAVEDVYANLPASLDRAGMGRFCVIG
jgi:hypothetical protein